MELAGTVGKLIYVDQDSAFYIFTVDDASDGRPKKVKGTFVMDKPTPGQFVRLEGQWEQTKWGPTFNATALSIPVPESVEGLAEYLQGHVKHIGPVLSRRLVEAFGADTVYVLDHEPERLETVERLSKRAREELIQAWNEQREYRQIAVDLLRIGLPKTLVTKAYQTWGATTMDRLRANPYALMELDGAGFVLADRLGLGLGLAPDAHARLAGMIEYVLERASQSEGHLYLTLPQLQEQLGRCIHQEGLDGFGRALEMNDLAMAVADLRNRDRVVVDGSRLYLSHAYHAETVAAERLATLLEAPSPLSSVDMEAFLSEYERVQGISLSEQQREAVAAVAEHPVVLVTGLPGTGKCVVGDTLVSGPWGFARIDSLAPDHLLPQETYDLDVAVDTSCGVRKAAYIYNGGVSDTIKIETSCGFVLEGTPEHPVRVVEEGQHAWRRLDELSPEDVVVLVRGSSYSFGDDATALLDYPSPDVTARASDMVRPTRMTKQLARLLGYVVSEGYLCEERSLSITAHEEQVLSYVEAAIEEVFALRTSRTFDKRYGCDVRVRVHSVRLDHWCHAQGVAQVLSAEQRVPECILRSSRSSVCAFLSALFEGDGAVSEDRYTIEYGSMSETLVRQVQMLLLSLGIVATCHPRSGGSWRLFISGEDYDRFRDEVGFHFTSLPERSLDSNTNMHLLYGIAPVLKRYMQAVRPSKGRDYNLFYRSATGRRQPSRALLDRLLSFGHEDLPVYAELQAFADPKFFYDKVASCERGQGQVYDFHVPGDHEFLSGGFISHNTTISKAIVKLFKEQNLRVELMSPTGIAAKRLSSVVGHSASTIHRALGYRGTEWMHGPNNPLQADAVLVDEFSMVDQSLLYHLLGSLKEGAVLVCVGDHAQLPSVGAGNVLHDMIRSQVIPRVNLTQIFRQEEASGIVLAAHSINQGQEPRRGYKDFQFVSVASERKVVEHIKTLVQRIQEKADRGVTFQVLSPRWAGTLGVTSLNEEIRNVLNPDKGQKAVSVGRGVSWRVGDRVIVMANDYDLGVYNGEQGTIVDIDTSNKEVKVRIRDRHTKVIPIGYKETHKMLKLAFCITIHKCVSPDTWVETPHGLMQIADIPRVGMIATPEGVKEYCNKIELPEREGFRVVSEGGYHVTVTPEHGLDVWDGTAYARKEASDIRKGDFLRYRLGEVVSPQYEAGLPEPDAGDVRERVYSTPSQMSKSFGELLGLLVADGCVHDRGVRLVKRHDDVVERSSELMREFFGVDPVEIETHGTKGWEVSSTFLSRWLRSLGGLAPHSKDIPPCVLQSSLQVQQAFLRGLFADASVHLKEGVFDHICLTQKNARMLDTVQTMLLRMGMASSRKDYPDRLPALYLYSEACQQFAQQVSFPSEFKRARLANVEWPATRRVVVPISADEVEWLWAHHRSAFSSASMRGNGKQRGYWSRGVVENLVSVLGDEAPPWLIERLAWLHVRVEALEPVRFTPMCVEVPDGHRFLQNGCSGWNSQGSEFDYVILPFVPSYGFQLQRNLFYTAITRAKSKVIMLGEWGAVERAVHNNEVTRRNTHFDQRVRALLMDEGDD